MLIHELAEQGVWLFRYRSYVPLVLLPLAVLAVYLHRGYLGGSKDLELYYGLFCLLISLLGLGVRGWALGYAQSGSSGRNTKEQIADNLNTRGPYSVVRHPLYLGNMLMMLGVLLFTKSVMLAVIGMLFYLLFYERIIATEERFLHGKFGDVFREWTARTPALIPRFRQWVQPSLPFSWKAAIKGEFYGFTAIVTVLLLLDLLRNWFAEGRVGTNVVWAGLWAVTVVLFFILRFIRKHTTFFEVANRREATAG